MQSDEGLKLPISWRRRETRTDDAGGAASNIPNTDTAATVLIPAGSAPGLVRAKGIAVCIDSSNTRSPRTTSEQASYLQERESDITK